jgi:hypothetical protein
VAAALHWLQGIPTAQIVETTASIVPSRMCCNYSRYTSLSEVTQHIQSGTLRAKEVHAINNYFNCQQYINYLQKE